MVAGVVGAASLLAACGTGGAPMGSPPPTGVGGNTVTISNFMFSPMSITVAPGSVVKVTNDDSATHTLSATGGQFNSGSIAQHQTKTFKAPLQPGVYSYICNIHQYMMGTIKVS
jgi:plastocyanin